MPTDDSEYDDEQSTSVAWTCDEDAGRENAEEDDVCDRQEVRSSDMEGLCSSMISVSWSWKMDGHIWLNNETNDMHQQKEQ